MIYPTSFPLPLIEKYDLEVDMGLRRTAMDCGSTRQRRRYRSMPTYFTFGFILSIEELHDWQAWVEANAYDWFVMDITSRASVHLPCVPHQVRFISGLEINAVNEELFSVDVTAELIPEAKALVYVEQTGDWILSGIPASPSTPDWIIGKTPIDHSINWVISGTPKKPASIV